MSLWQAGAAHEPEAALDLAAALEASVENQVQWPALLLGKPGHRAGPVRLVAFRLSLESAARHRQGLRGSMRKQGRTPFGASAATGRLAPLGDQCACVQAALFDAELPLPLTLAGGIDFPSNQVGPAPGPNRIRRPFQGPVRNLGAVDRRGPALFDLWLNSDSIPV